MKRESLRAGDTTVWINHEAGFDAQTEVTDASSGQISLQFPEGTVITVAPGPQQTGTGDVGVPVAFQEAGEKKNGTDKDLDLKIGEKDAFLTPNTTDSDPKGGMILEGPSVEYPPIDEGSEFKLRQWIMVSSIVSWEDESGKKSWEPGDGSERGWDTEPQQTGGAGWLTPERIKKGDDPGVRIRGTTIQPGTYKSATGTVTISTAKKGLDHWEPKVANGSLKYVRFDYLIEICVLKCKQKKTETGTVWETIGREWLWIWLWLVLGKDGKGGVGKKPGQKNGLGAASKEALKAVKKGYASAESPRQPNCADK